MTTEKSCMTILTIVCLIVFGLSLWMFLKVRNNNENFTFGIGRQYSHPKSFRGTHRKSIKYSPIKSKYKISNGPGETIHSIEESKYPMSASNISSEGKRRFTNISINSVSGPFGAKGTPPDLIRRRPPGLLRPREHRSFKIHGHRFEFDPV